MRVPVRSGLLVEARSVSSRSSSTWTLEEPRGYNEPVHQTHHVPGYSVG